MPLASTVSTHPIPSLLARSCTPRTVYPARQKIPISLKSELGPSRLQSQNNSAQGLFSLCAGLSVTEPSISCTVSVLIRVELSRAIASR